METLLSSRYIFILFALVGLLLGVGFVYPSLWWGGVIGVALLTILVIRSANFKQATLGAGLAWSVKNLAVLIWVFSVEPYAWLPVAAAQPTPLALGFFWLYGALALGLGGLVWGLVTKLAYNNFKTSVFILTLPIVWVVSELVGSFLFSILTYGEGGNITTSLSFGYIGYLLAQHKLLVLLATMGGVYALTATSVLLGSLIASSVMHYSTLQKKIAILFGVVLLIMATTEVKITSSV